MNVSKCILSCIISQKWHLVLFLLLNFCIRYSKATLKITDDGPGVLDIPITFTVELPPSALTPDSFSYEFQENHSKTFYEMKSSEKTVSKSIIFSSDKFPEGQYNMIVTVYVVIADLKLWQQDRGTHQFTLNKDLTCHINISQSDLDAETLQESYVIVNRTVNTTALIHDPSGYFSKASNTYYWYNGDQQYQPTALPQMNFNFTTSKDYNISVFIKSNLTNQVKGLVKAGRTYRVIKAKDPISDINVIGNTWLDFGELLQLNVSCSSGSKPFWYCLRIRDNKIDNFTCLHRERIYTEECSFPIIHYFPKNATYYVQIGINNPVSFSNKTIKVNVFKITHQQQLFFVIIPVISCILAIIIIVVGIAFHLQQRQQYAVEVADFDFQRTENLNEKTFFERVSESCSKSIKGRFLHPCSRVDYDDLSENE